MAKARDFKLCTLVRHAGGRRLKNMKKIALSSVTVCLTDFDDTYVM